MIKIVHLITGLGLGGAENQLVHFVTESDPSRFKHIVISMQDNGRLGTKLLAHGISVYTLNMQRGIPSIEACWSLMKILRFEDPHILQTWLYHADLLGLLIGKMLRVPKIIWNLRCSNMNTDHYSWLTSFVIKACSRLSGFPDAVIVNSTAGKQTHQRLGYRVQHWLTIPNGFNTEYFKPDQKARGQIRSILKIDEEVPILGMIARFDPMKDHDSFLLSINKLRNRIQHFRVILLGTDIDKKNTKLMAKIKELKLEDYILLLGPRQDMPEVMNALDILVLTSAFGEGFSNVLGEAMACGIVCVATDVGDSAEIIGTMGKIVPPKSPEILAQALEEFIVLDKQKKSILGQQARQSIIDRYHVSMMIKKYESAYEALFKVGSSRNK